MYEKENVMSLGYKLLNLTLQNGGRKRFFNRVIIIFIIMIIIIFNLKLSQYIYVREILYFDILFITVYTKTEFQRTLTLVNGQLF